MLARSSVKPRNKLWALRRIGVSGGRRKIARKKVHGGTRKTELPPTDQLCGAPGTGRQCGRDFRARSGDEAFAIASLLEVVGGRASHQPCLHTSPHPHLQGKAHDLPQLSAPQGGGRRGMSEVPRCRDRQETAPARPKQGEGAAQCPPCGLPPARRGCMGRGEQEGAAPGVLGIGLASAGS